MPIPEVDLSSVNISIPDHQLNRSDLVFVATLVKDAFSQWGFVYFTGHGIQSQQIEDIFRTSKEFFGLSPDVKEKYKRGILGPRTNSGYIKMGMETFDPRAPVDIKEAFGFAVEVQGEMKELWPTELPNFELEMKSFVKACVRLSLRILHIIGLALNLDDPLYFVQQHQLLGEIGNSTTLRTMHYPPVKRREDVKPGQLRCSEHSDYGTFTLLFQDDAGGLMVKSRSGEFVQATPVKDAVLVNIADLMQRWTNDELISVRHKVIIPEEELHHRRGRQSIAFFVQPDDACDIICINGSNKYPMVNAKEYLWSRFKDTYLKPTGS